MDHGEARELIELAGAEPGGLDRLMAGDTPEAAALAAHLAGCPDCTAELAHVRRTTTLVRAVLRDRPDPGLRERTLAYVRELGVERGESAPGAPVATTSEPRPADRRRRSFPAVLPWAASIAATALVAVAATLALVGAPSAGPGASPDAPPEVAGLARVVTWTNRIEAEPDAQRIAMTAPDGSATMGSLVFSPGTGELVVVATDLAEPPAGAEYGCWVEDGEGRRRMGKMFFGGGLAYWAGPVDGLEEVEPGTRFGVSLVDLASPGVEAEPVLVGDL